MMAEKSNGTRTNGLELGEIEFGRKLCASCLCEHNGPIRGKQFCHSRPFSFSLNKYQNEAEIHHGKLCENYAAMHLEQHYRESFLKIQYLEPLLMILRQSVLSGAQESISLRNNPEDFCAPSLRAVSWKPLVQMTQSVNNPWKSTETYCSHGLASLPIIGIQYFKSLNWSFAQTAQVVKNL